MEEGAIGLPPGMVGRREELTPMLSQYADLCVAYDEALVLFQVGDFYEAFCEGAAAIARELEITLTKREDSTGEYPMAGIPIDNAAAYIERLLAAGYRVAIADQVQDPAEATGPVDRAVTRVVTPGTAIDDDLLEPGTSNYVACLVSSETDDGEATGTERTTGTRQTTEIEQATETERTNEVETSDRVDDRTPESATHAVAFADVSAGDFLVTSGPRDIVADELERFAPAEVLVAPGVDTTEFDLPGTVSAPREGTLDGERAADRIEAAGSSPAELKHPAEIRACGALLAYVEYTRGDVGGGTGASDTDADGDDADGNGSENGNGSMSEDADSSEAGDGDDGSAGGGDETPSRGRFGTISQYEPADHLRLDATALRGLEVFTNRENGDEHTLFSVLDDTACALGRRRLADWVRRPLVDAAAIETRHDAVAELVERSLVREELRELLRDVYDLSRLLTRISRERANARDLRSLGSTLDAVPEVRDVLAECESEEIAAIRTELDDCGDVRGLIERAIRPEPPIEITEGGVIDPDFDEGLGSLRETERSGKQWVADLEADEREKTGIDSLSVGFNQVHGYYIEVTKANLDRVPDEYTRRQTLKNAERFYTPDLKRREEEIVSAGERADEREYELFCDVRGRVGAEADRIDRVADALADLDALCTLAAIAVERDYTRPEIGGGDLAIDGCRHPVVEAVQESFVPNDVSLHSGEVAIVTGPNMSGKSTYMRGVALCVLLAQIGGFVPARAARLPVVDRIFTRVGASDDIAGGQSTFMREMTELATVLREATPESLVILDEVGRGTSTVDGTAIARAAIERLHDSVGARTLFATHYHELTDLASGRERVSNYHFAADRGGNEADGSEAITFLHSVAKGASSASYGIDVAQLAGVPEPIVARSRTLVAGEAESPTGDSPAGADGERTSDERANGRESNVEIGVTTPVTNGRGDEDGEGGGTDGTSGDLSDGKPTASETAIPARNGTTRRTDEADTANGSTGRVSGETNRANGENGSNRLNQAGRTSGAGTRGIETVLREVDVAHTTPLEALRLLDELKGRLDDERSE